MEFRCAELGNIIKVMTIETCFISYCASMNKRRRKEATQKKSLKFVTYKRRFWLKFSRPVFKPLFLMA